MLSRPSTAFPIASPAVSPARMKSSTRGPRAGSVMFWLATAPTPARACGQRAPTAIEEVAMAIPKAPDLAQWPAIENVMLLGSVSDRSVGNNGGHFDLDQPFGARQSGDHEAGRTGKDALQPFSHFTVNGLTVANVGEVDHDAADVIEGAARFFHQELDVAHGCFGLGARIARMQRPARVEILRHLTAQEYHRAAGNDRLAEIVVELLLRISLARVERTNASVRRHYSAAILRLPQMRGDRPAAFCTNSRGPAQGNSRWTAARWAKGGDWAKS